MNNFFGFLEAYYLYFVAELTFPLFYKYVLNRVVDKRENLSFIKIIPRSDQENGYLLLSVMIMI